ncbi:MAG: hypothetical protein M0T70_05805 [Geobacteraceae bacterium]|nr:hypothetical protein [Geobacteraceae bacterium]
MRKRYLQSFITPTLGMFSLLVTATAGGLVAIKAGGIGGAAKNRSGEHIARFDVVHELQIRFAAEHGVADPVALVAAVRHSPMANLLINVAIEESLGDPVAKGSSGEEGAWQVIASHWGAVPEDIRGQAGQAERIIRSLLISVKGNRKEALARYNGGSTPPVRSYRYAERILKRTGQLQFAVNFLPPKGTLSGQI